MPHSERKHMIVENKKDFLFLIDVFGQQYYNFIY